MLLEKLFAFEEGYKMSAYFTDLNVLKLKTSLKAFYTAFCFTAALFSILTFKRLKRMHDMMLGGFLTYFLILFAITFSFNHSEIHAAIHIALLFICMGMMYIPFLGTTCFIAGNAFGLSYILTIVSGISFYILFFPFYLLLFVAVVSRPREYFNIVFGRATSTIIGILYCLLRSYKYNSIDQLNSIVLSIVVPVIYICSGLVNFYVQPKIQKYEMHKTLERIYGKEMI